MNTRTIVIVATLGIALLLAALLRGPRAVRAPEPIPTTVTLSTENPEPRISPFGHSTVSDHRETPRHSVSSPSIATTTTSRQLHAPLTGFVVDDFRGWTAIPPGYRLDGLQLRDGAIALSDASPTGPRTGSLLSPALELWQPALSAPSEKSAAMPEGCSVQTQIALSEDGRTWGDWVTIERRVTPDGQQAAPEGPPAWSGSRPSNATFGTSGDSTTSAPLIRYRLTLTSQDSASPVVQDIRIWRNSRL